MPVGWWVVVGVGRWYVAGCSGGCDAFGKYALPIKIVKLNALIGSTKDEMYLFSQKVPLEISQRTFFSTHFSVK